jgi:hypothetical protein
MFKINDKVFAVDKFALYETDIVDGTVIEIKTVQSQYMPTYITLVVESSQIMDKETGIMHLPQKLEVTFQEGSVERVAATREEAILMLDKTRVAALEKLDREWKSLLEKTINVENKMQQIEELLGLDVDDLEIE